MKRLLLLVFISVLAETLSARTCPKCHGSGQMKIFYSMSTYGLSRDKQQCPICKRWITVGTEHSEKCDRCDGTGHVETLMDKRNAERAAETEDVVTDGLSNLTPAELSQYQALQELLKGHSESIDCQACNKTGRCHVCNGTGYANGAECPVCYTTGKCIGCYGTGCAGSRYVEPTEEEKKEILGRMAELLTNAMNRNNGDDYSVENTFSLSGDADTQKNNDTIPTIIGWVVIIGVIGWVVYKLLGKFFTHSVRKRTSSRLNRRRFPSGHR